MNSVQKDKIRTKNSRPYLRILFTLNILENYFLATAADKIGTVHALVGQLYFCFYYLPFV